jgi:hypothetical protein
MTPVTRPARLTALWALLAVLTGAPYARAGDPYLEWFTIETPYFHVHFHGGLEEVADRTATLAEAINARLMPHMGWRPSEVTQIVLSDGTDDANGSARGIPYNAIEMFVTAPDDLSTLSDYDDWILKLLTHEHVHILHVDNIQGIPALVNALVGKTWSPNQIQPRWILEGFAVALESRFTSGGRIRSSLFDMYLRADVLEDNVFGLDRMSHSTRRWPRGHIWYLYGGKFFAWLEETYGDGVLAAIADDYAQNPFAWGINRSVRRATGRTYPELFDAWVADLRRHYGAMVREIGRRGRREGKRLTHHGGNIANPRFTPRCFQGGGPGLLYHRDDGHEPDGLYWLPLPGPTRALEDESTMIIRTRGSDRQASFTPDCGVVFDSVAPSQQRRRFSELHLQPPGTTSKLGLLGTRVPLTRGQRARDPDVSPDGRRVAFVTNHKGTSTLRIAHLTPERRLEGVRALVPSARFEQAYSPRWSPDGRTVAYSAWTQGGYRDIRIVEVATGEFAQVTRDRAMDMQPAWSPDGRTLFFASDRTGVANIYAYDLDARKLWQVTNVVNGAYMPEVAPDGKTLYYVGYTWEGFDLFALPLDPARYLEAPPPPKRPDPPTDPGTRRWPVRDYNPLPTLRPRRYEVEYGDGQFGKALSVRIAGEDAVGLHGINLRGTYQTELDGLTWGAGYSYRYLPFTFNASLFRDVVPRAGLRIGGNTERIREALTGFTTGASFSMPGEFDGQNVSLAYTLSVRDPDIPVGAALDPFAEATQLPFSGMLSSLQLAYSYDATQRAPWSISTERGISLSLSGDYAGRETGSEETLQAFRGRLSGYVPMPWLRHHVLASSVGAGAASGTYPNRGYFFTGGFTEQDLVEDFQSGIRQSAFVLRGYEPGQFVGRRFFLLNSEYRFPIWYAERGVSTLPVFFGGVHGAAFVDWGGAFDTLDPENPLAALHPSIGAELRLGFTLGYALDGALRIGWARGLDAAAPGLQNYFVFAGSF